MIHVCYLLQGVSLRQISDNVRKQVFTPQVIKIIEKPKWMLKKEDCELFKLKNVWSYITKISIDKLDVSNCQYPSLLRDVGTNKIQFSVLKTLNLQEGNRISSIQFLPMLRTQILQNIFLNNNQIVNINPIAKMNSRCLRKLNIQSNYCSAFGNKLNRAFLQCKKLNKFKQFQQFFCKQMRFELKIDFPTADRNIIAGKKHPINEQDLSSLIKLSLQRLNLQYIFVLHNTLWQAENKKARIQQQKIKQMMRFKLQQSQFQLQSD